jgi:hypothetical protein
MKVVLLSTIKQDNEVCNGISIDLSNASPVQKKYQMKEHELGRNVKSLKDHGRV